MSKELKNQVLAFLKNPSKDKYDRFNKAFDFYKKSPNKSAAVETKLNRSGFTEDGLQNLMYDLQKLYDISDADVASKKGTEVPKEAIIEETTLDELYQQFHGGMAELEALKAAEPQDIIAIGKIALKVLNVYEEIASAVLAEKMSAMKKSVDELSELKKQQPKDLALIAKFESDIDQQKSSIDSFIKEGKDFVASIMPDEVLKEKLLKESAPEKSEIPGISQNSENSETEKSLSEKVIDFVDPTFELEKPLKIVHSEDLTPIRDEFPFLNEADCPEIMFVVVGKRISAYRRYQGLHAKLQDALANPGSVTDEEQAKLAADTQEANAENIALWDELKYYNDHKEILGKHPLFKESVAKKEVEAMTTEELAKFRTSSATFISKKKKALEAKGVTEDKKAELEQAIKDRQFKLSLVNAKLGIADGQK